MFAGWTKKCADVSTMEKNSMMAVPIMQMSDLPSFSGSKIGFILNEATVTSFVVSTIIYSGMDM